MLQDPADRIDALFAPWSMGLTPGAAVLVIRYGRVIHSKGYGLADLGTKAPIDPGSTRFELASVSKPITAMAVLILAERGDLDLVDPLAAFYPEFKGPAAEVTVEQLLWHTSGLPDFHDLFVRADLIADYGPRAATARDPQEYEPTLADVIDLLAKHDELLFEPGTEEDYSNSNYALLAGIVEQVAGRRFAQVVEDEIFAPAGMTHSLVRDERQQQVPHRARSYSWSRGKYGDIDYSPLSGIYGPSGVWTTAADLARWDEALGTDLLISPGLLDQAFARGRLGDGRRTATGYGWFVSRPMVWHDGGWLGFRTHVRRYLNRPLTIAVLSNCAEMNAHAMAEEVAGIYLA